MIPWSIRIVTALLGVALVYLYSHGVHLFRLGVVLALYYLIFLDRVPVFDWDTKERKTAWCWVWQKHKRWELWEQEKEQFYHRKDSWQKMLDSQPNHRV